MRAHGDAFLSNADLRRSLQRQRNVAKCTKRETVCIYCRICLRKKTGSKAKMSRKRSRSHAQKGLFGTSSSLPLRHIRLLRKGKGVFRLFSPKLFSLLHVSLPFWTHPSFPGLFGCTYPPTFCTGSVSVCNFPVRRRKHLDMEFSAKGGKPTMVDDMVPRSDFFLTCQLNVAL